MLSRKDLAAMRLRRTICRRALAFRGFSNPGADPRLTECRPRLLRGVAFVAKKGVLYAGLGLGRDFAFE